MIERRRSSPIPITTGFDHIAALTTDIERHADFYRQVFDAEVSVRMDATPDHPRMFILDMGSGAALKVFERSEDEIVGDRATPGRRGAIDHFGIAVGSLAALEQVEQRLIANGVLIGEIQRIGPDWSLSFRDVDGMELEVCTPVEQSVH